MNEELMKESEEVAEKVIELIEATPPVVVFVDPCEGCTNRVYQTKLDFEGRILDPDAQSCSKYLYPERQHSRTGGCAMDTRKAAAIKADFKLNPLKASKRTYGKK
jgi:hypothetical protein